MPRRERGEGGAVEGELTEDLRPIFTYIGVVAEGISGHEVACTPNSWDRMEVRLMGVRMINNQNSPSAVRRGAAPVSR